MKNLILFSSNIILTVLKLSFLSFVSLSIVFHSETFFVAEKIITIRTASPLYNCSFPRLFLVFFLFRLFSIVKLSLLQRRLYQYVLLVHCIIPQIADFLDEMCLGLPFQFHITHRMINLDYF